MCLEDVFVDDNFLIGWLFLKINIKILKVFNGVVFLDVIM